MAKRKNENLEPHCDFCKKPKSELGGQLVEGPGSLGNGRKSGEDTVWICPLCVGICATMYAKSGVEVVTKSQEEDAPLPQLVVPDPRQIKAHLDQHVIGQDHAKRILSVAVANHYKRLVTSDDFMKEVEIEKSNILMVGPTGSGKAQPLYSAVYTPSGKKTMGDIVVGDEVLTPDGGVAKVTGVYPQGKKDIFRVHFSNGDFVDACGDHLWLVDSTKRGWCDKIVDTRYLLNNAKSPNGDRQLSIRMPAPVAFAERFTMLDPYLVGILLGEGSFTTAATGFSTADDQILQSVMAALPPGYCVSKAFRPADYRIRKIKRNNDPNIIRVVFKMAGIDGKMAHEKYVPKEYLHNSVGKRLSLLQGLMDADGTVGKGGNVSFCSTSEKLAQDVKWLVESLGGICTVCKKESFYTYNGERKRGRLAYICHIRMTDEHNLFRLDRKRKLTRVRTKYLPKRVIDRVERLGHMEAKCIMVDHPDHLYLTDHFVVTHNTLLARSLAKILNVPFAIGDATTMTEAGYVGEDVENLLLRLLRAADMNLALAQRGILYVDEIDKIGRTNQNMSMTRDVSGEGVQQSLLKMLEGTIAQVPPQGGRKHPEGNYIPFDTTNVLFICGGTFVGLTEIVKRRIGGGSMGFVSKGKADLTDDEYLRKVATEDLVEFGLIPEFIGRLPVKTSLDKMTEEGLVQVLTEPNNAIVKQYQKMCHRDNVGLKFDDEACREIAKMALKRETGARALRSVVEEVMIDIMFDIADHSGQEIVITGERVRKLAA